MSTPLTRQSQHRGHAARAEGSEPNRADSADGPSLHELRPEPGREKPSNHLRLDAVVDEESPLDDRIHDWGPHILLLLVFDYYKSYY